jgi:hypothetical protein
MQMRKRDRKTKSTAVPPDDNGEVDIVPALIDDFLASSAAYLRQRWAKRPSLDGAQGLSAHPPRRKYEIN